MKRKTDRRQQIIDLLDLNRSELVDARRTAYEACVDLLKGLLEIVKEPDSDLATRKAELLVEYGKGIAEYSLVGRHALRDCKDALDEVLGTH